MENIKAWVLSICLASFAAGILQYIAPQNSRNSVIKLVLTLYILVAAFAPIQALKYPDTRIALPEVLPQENIVDAESVIKEQTKANIESQLYEICASAGCPLESVDISMKNYEVISVTATAQNSEGAENAIKAQLGENTAVYVNSGE
ncbi:MAG: hypothetical protein EOM30_02255 [Clostridia bacterium]|nr:hypothetical protein [Clostridia bacterium]NLS85876.1 hypothetical protein [Oscillospiraceae bacterium]